MWFRLKRDSSVAGDVYQAIAGDIYKVSSHRARIVESACLPVLSFECFIAIGGIICNCCLRFFGSQSSSLNLSGPYVDEVFEPSIFLQPSDMLQIFGEHFIEAIKFKGVEYVKCLP